MNVVTQTKRETTSPPPAPVEDDKKGLGLTVGSVLAGALAAITSAVLGSSLGTGGTVFGAGVGSVIAAVSGALYTAGLQRTHEGLKVVVQRRRDPGEPSGDPGSGPTILNAGPSPVGRRASRDRRRGVLLAGGVLAGAVAAFVLAMTGITVFESTAGTSLSGAQGRTTVDQVVRPAATTDVAEPSVEPTALPSVEATAREQPGAGSTPSATPSAAAATPTAPTAASTPQPVGTTAAPAPTAPVVTPAS